MAAAWRNVLRFCVLFTLISTIYLILNKTIHVQLQSNDEFPDVLLRTGIYKESDFLQGRLPFWNCTNGTCNNGVWGPCYPPRNRVDWKTELQNNDHLPVYEKPTARDVNSNAPDGLCRPGFLIIGAGKCGTSSLYHYLTEHPRVMPAVEKQIHYFKYYRDRPFRWYLRHFPNTESFLSAGALITGEASPGYLPYPDVPHEIQRRMPGSRIIVLGRNPLERAYSSYRYNYVDPTIEAFKKGKVRSVPRNLTDDEYADKYLYTFEDMVWAELQTLKECFLPAGPKILEANQYWSQFGWARHIYERRSPDLPPLIDLDGFCYGDVVSPTILRKQWTSLKTEQPDKIIIDKNLHLVQSFIGRSLYVLPLEWWYEQFESDDIYFMCTEELRDLSGESLHQVSDFLGLPSFNFSITVSEGAYNVGGHKGYDTEVKWSTVSSEKPSQTDIPLSAELRDEILEFIRPFNERLFGLTGRRCDW